MAEKKYRAQILLEPEQHKALANIAKERDQSISHVVREIVAEYLVDSDQDARSSERLELLNKMTRLRKEIEARSGVLDGDLINEIREERAQELWDRLRIDENNRD